MGLCLSHGWRSSFTDPQFFIASVQSFQLVKPLAITKRFIAPGSVSPVCTSAGGGRVTTRSVCAVVVTYHPTTEMMENLPSVLAQVDGLVVVDNGSNPNELDPLRKATQAQGVHLIENGENLGIAEALNQGIRWASGEGFPWIILFDQDSKITVGFIEQMFASWTSHPEQARVCSIHPRYVHPETGLEQRVRRAPDGGPIISITSGALMPTWIFDKIGGFASEYFIDWVDIEYSYRIRAAGFPGCRLEKGRTAPLRWPSQAIFFSGVSFQAGSSQRDPLVLHESESESRYIGNTFAYFHGVDIEVHVRIPKGDD